MTAAAVPEPHRALQDLVLALSARIEDHDGHPWIPGFQFRDGQIIAALEQAKQALEPPPGLYEQIRQNLLAARLEQKLSQKIVADRMGTQPSALSALETGDNRNPTIDTLEAWARAVNLRIDIWFTPTLHGVRKHGGDK